MALAINLQRKVRIENNKLAVCQIILQLLVVGLVGYNVYSSRMWNVRYDPVGSVSYWVTGGEEYDLQVAEDLKAPICTDNAQFDYNDGSYVYDNFECVELESIERYKKLPGALFIRTLVEESFTGKVSADKTTEGQSCEQACAVKYEEGDCKKMHPAFDETDVPSGLSGKTNRFGECLCECKTSTDFWPLGVTGLGVAFEHTADVSYAPGDSDGVSSSVDGIGGMYTFLYDQAGNVVKEFAPGESVNIPVKTFLEIIGVDLDGTELPTTPNTFGEPARKYPILRITGGEINVDISYYNPSDKENKHPDKGYVAYISIKGRPMWNSQQEVSYGATPPGLDKTGLARTRYMYNLSFSFRTQGKFSKPDPAALMGVLAILIIYIKFPNMIVGLLAEYGLGNISKMYQAAIRQKIDAESVFSGVVARGLVYSAVFDHLILPKEEGGNLPYSTDDEPTITSKRLEHLILEMMKSGGRINDMREAEKVRSLLAIEMQGNNRRKFLDVALNSDLSTLANMADNFDSKRKQIPVGERLFKEKSKRRGTVTNIKIPDFDFD